ncbi:hypothetical protein ACEWY4_024178 [Coilia grayii]|uniref:TRASH domain-containing protein n=1 Tax=Coilia grayii TaxID=363190 RepID=A0ABD1J280_9TELE
MDGIVSPTKEEVSEESNGLSAADSRETISRDGANEDGTNTCGANASTDLNSDSPEGNTVDTVSGGETGANEAPERDGGDGGTGGVTDVAIESGLIGDDNTNASSVTNGEETPASAPTDEGTVTGADHIAPVNVAPQAMEEVDGTNGEDTPAPAPTDEGTVTGADHIAQEEVAPQAMEQADDANREETPTPTPTSEDGASSQEVVRDSTQPEPPTQDERTVTGADQVTQEEVESEGMDVDSQSPAVEDEEGEGQREEVLAGGAEGGERQEEGEGQREAVVAGSAEGKEGEGEEEEGQREAVVAGAAEVDVEEKGEGQEKAVVAGAENWEGAVGDMEVDEPLAGDCDTDPTVLEIPVVSEIKEEVSMDSEPSGSSVAEQGVDTDAFAGLDMGVDMEMSAEGLNMDVGSATTAQASDTKTAATVPHRVTTSRTTETDNEDLDMGVESVVEENTGTSSDSGPGDKAKKLDSGAFNPDEDLSVGLKQEIPDASSDNAGSSKDTAPHKPEANASDSRCQYAVPAEDLRLCIKDEPLDEAYDQALNPFTTENIKDEPNTAEDFDQKLSEEFKISAVYSVGQTQAVTAAKPAAPAAVAAPVKPAVPVVALPHQLPAASAVCVLCSGCSKVLLKGQTAYQRKGSPQLYCSTTCLTGSTGTVIKTSTRRNCHFCLRLIVNPKDVIIAPVDKAGVVKDFCSQKCLTSFNFKRDGAINMTTASKGAPNVITLAAPPPSATTQSSAVAAASEPKARCSACQKIVVTKHEVNFMGTVHKLCSDECFTRYRSSNKLAINCCSNCGGYCYQSGTGHTLQIDNISKKFCSQACITTYRKKTLTTVPCTMCKVNRPSSDMLEGVDNKGKTELFCSATCVTAHRVHTVSSSGTALTCDKCQKTAVPQYHLAMSDGSIRNFCTFNCVVSFQDNFNKTSAQAKMNVVQAKTSVAPATPVATPEPSSSPAVSQNAAPSPTQVPPAKSIKVACRQCNRAVTSRPEAVEVKGKMFVTCGKQCAEEFRKANIHPGRCEYCKMDKGVKDVKRVENVERYFCSEGCALLHRHDLARRFGRKHCRQCKYCGNISRHLVKSLFSGKHEEFCSQECVSGQTLLFCQVAKCSLCQRTRTMSESLCWLGQMKHFCNLTCVLGFCYQHGNKEPLSKIISTQATPTLAVQSPPVSKEATPIIANVISLSSTPNGQPSVLSNPALQGAEPNMPVKNTGHASTQTDSLKIPPPQPPRILKNKSLLCKPLTQTKGTLCKPTHQTAGTQTEAKYPDVLVLPIPVPVFVPVPMNLYSQYTPQPLGLPLPVPVPMFLPTTLDSAEKIVETIQQIKEKIPTDPLEADLILMAEMVAEDNNKDQSDTPAPSTSIDDVPDSSPPTLADFDLDALGWDEDLLSDRAPNTPVSSVDPVVPKPPEEHVDLEADFPIEVLEKAAAAAEQPAEPKPPPSKRPRRSQAIMKRRSPRTRPPVEAPVVPAQTRKLQAVYGVKAWKRWVQWRNSQPNIPTPRFGSRPIVLKEDLLQCTTAELSYGLCKFISEYKRPNGESYSPDSVYYLCLGIQQHLFENGRMENIFADFFYNKFTQEITKLLQDWQPVVTPGGYIHSRVEEEYLWECKQLGAYSPGVLLYTLFFFCTKLFGLRSVAQHQRLSFAHVMRCTRSTPSGKAVCLRFYPPIARKDTPNDDEEASAKRKKEDEEEDPVLEMQENLDNPLRCPVRIYEFYLSKCSPSVKQRTNAFYLLPERCCVPNSPMWFSSTPLDGDALQAMLTRILTVRELHLPQEPSTAQHTSSDEQDSD